MRDKDDYQSFADGMNDAEKARENRDFNLAISDIMAGQQPRFIPEENTPAALQKKKDKEYAALSALIHRLMTDHAYAAYYTETLNMLSEAEKAADDAMAYFAAQRTAAEQSLREMLENATYLKGHGAVFKDGDKVRLLDGTVIDDLALLDSIVWKEDSATYIEAATQRDNAERFNASYDDAHRYRHDTLGNVREQMEDEENPVTREKMEELRELIQDQPDALFTNELKTSAAPSIQVEVAMEAFKPSL